MVVVILIASGCRPVKQTQIELKPDIQSSHVVLAALCCCLRAAANVQLVDAC
jgi:hypothetical protein